MDSKVTVKIYIVGKDFD